MPSPAVRKRGLLSGLCALGAVGFALGVAAAPPAFQGSTATVEPPCMPIFAKVVGGSLEDGVVHVHWTTAGRHRLEPGEFAPDGRAVRYTYLGCYAAVRLFDAHVRQADGAEVPREELAARLVPDAVVLISMDEQAIAPEFLARVQPDTLVLQIAEISLTESPE